MMREFPLKMIKSKKIIILLNLFIVILSTFLIYEKVRVKDHEIVFVMMSDNLKLNYELVDDLTDITLEYGYKKINSMGYDTDNQYFGQVISTKGYYGSDIFIFNKELAMEFLDMNLYDNLPSEVMCYSDNYILDGDVVVGINLSDNYYLFINKNSNKNENLLIDLACKILEFGGDFNG